MNSVKLQLILQNILFRLWLPDLHWWLSVTAGAWWDRWGQTLSPGELGPPAHRPQGLLWGDNKKSISVWMFIHCWWKEVRTTVEAFTNAWCVGLSKWIVWTTETDQPQCTLCHPTILVGAQWHLLLATWYQEKKTQSKQLECKLKTKLRNPIVLFLIFLFSVFWMRASLH